MGGEPVADRFTLPRVRAADAITDASGRAVSAFVRFWDTVCRKIEGQEAAQGQLITALEEAVAAIAAAQAAAAAAATAAADAQEAANTAQTAANAAQGAAAGIELQVIDLNDRVAALEAVP